MSPSTKKWLQRQKRRHPRRWPDAQNKPIFTAAPELPQLKKRFLLAQNEFHHGWAIFLLSSNIWSTTETSQELKFLKGLDHNQSHLELLRRGYKWQWQISPPLCFNRDGGLDRSADASARPPINNTPTCSQDRLGIALSATETSAESRAAGRTGATVRAG